MTLSRAQASSSSRLDSLIARHAALSRVLDEEIKHPITSEWEIKQLKRQKLKLKDDMVQLRE